MLFRRDVDSADLTWPSALLEKEMLQHWCCHPSSFDGINESAWAHSLVMGGQYLSTILQWMICTVVAPLFTVSINCFKMLTPCSGQVGVKTVWELESLSRSFQYYSP